MYLRKIEFYQEGLKNADSEAKQRVIQYKLQKYKYKYQYQYQKQNGGRTNPDTTDLDKKNVDDVCQVPNIKSLKNINMDTLIARYEEKDIIKIKINDIDYTLEPLFTSAAGKVFKIKDSNVLVKLFFGNAPILAEPIFNLYKEIHNSGKIYIRHYF